MHSGVVMMSFNHSIAKIHSIETMGRHPDDCLFNNSACTRLGGVKQSIVSDTFEKKSKIRVPSREDAAQIAGVVASGKSISVLVLATLSIPCGEQLVSRGSLRKIEPL